jgi:hypothetical protein
MNTEQGMSNNEVLCNFLRNSTFLVQYSTLFLKRRSKASSDGASYRMPEFAPRHPRLRDNAFIILRAANLLRSFAWVALELTEQAPLRSRYQSVVLAESQ